MDALRRAASIFAIAALCSCASTTQYPVAQREREALEVVARRISAYNAHDIDAMLSTYDAGVRIYDYPDRLLGTGTQRLRAIFGPPFAAAAASVRVVEQFVIENRVVSIEDVTIEGVRERNIAIYMIANGRIREVRLLEPDPKQP